MIQQFISLLLVILLTWSISPQNILAKTIKDEAIVSINSINPYLEKVKENITEFTLNNKLKFIVLENHQAPVISFITYVDVGGINEDKNKTGAAHFLEHLAFKGTKEIGTINYQQEQVIFNKLDKVFNQIKEAKKNNDTAKLTLLQQEFQQLNQQAHQLVKPNEFGQIVEIEGGVGLNAATSADYTAYFYNFPSNKLELWMYLESERYLNPVFREFYQEKQVILEERKLRTDNSPIGKMVEAFLDTAFTNHPYKRPVIGYEEDISNLTREDIQKFFTDYYGGSNVTIAIVGDVDPQQVKTMAKKYFGRFPTAKKSGKVNTIEPLQTKTREVTVKYPSQPIYLEGYHIPNINDPDYIVYDIMSSILSNGRTSRLYQSLVEEQKIALNASGFNGFPGNKYDNLMMFYAASAPNRNLDELETALHAEIEKLKNELVTEAELERVKTLAKANLLRRVDSNSGMARLLAEYEAKTGSWLNLFTSLNQISAVTAKDIQIVAQKTFKPENKTIGRLVTSASSSLN
jgi:predicted Zn-dependent peptidase